MWAPEPLGHSRVIEGLWRACAGQRLPHALLFHGPAGIGKFAAAKHFVQGLICDQAPGSPCGSCGPCKRIAAGSFADIFILDPIALELEVVKIGYITHRDDGPSETIDSFFDLKAAEGGVRAVIVREFDRATVQAQNALLKTLEEPGEGALLILETSRPDRLLETIRSRCVPVALRALSAHHASEVLAREGLIGAEAEAYVRWSCGSPGVALRLAREGTVALRKQLEGVLFGGEDPLLSCPAIFAIEAEFPGKTPTAQARARLRAALDLLMKILRDVLALRAGADPESLAHADLAQRVDWSDARLAAALRTLLALSGEVGLNLAPEGILDRALCAVREAGRESRRAKAKRAIR